MYVGDSLEISGGVEEASNPRGLDGESKRIGLSMTTGEQKFPLATFVCKNKKTRGVYVSVMFYGA